MNIYINGEAQQVQASTLAELVIALDLQQKRIAVEMNGNLVPKSRHASTLLSEGATIEIIQAVGGG
ncbi:MAG: sulfur carrier protein ThiS [Moraxellaceae bacterium]|nr:MAG: sulfur carrier protein ThiS [Moraxellaceae bacterium]